MFVHCCAHGADIVVHLYLCTAVQMVLTCDPHLIAAVFDRQLDGVFIDKTPGVQSFDIVWPLPSPSSLCLSLLPSMPVSSFSYEDC